MGQGDDIQQSFALTLKVILQTCIPAQGRGRITIAVDIFLVKEIFDLQEDPYFLQVIFCPEIGQKVSGDRFLIVRAGILSGNISGIQDQGQIGKWSILNIKPCLMLRLGWQPLTGALVFG